MHLDYAIPCRYAEAAGSLGTIVGAGIDSWLAPELPIDLGLMLAVRLAGAADEIFGATIRFRCHVESPEGEPVGQELDLPIGPIPDPGVRQDWAVGLFMPVAIRWPAEEYGTYMLQLQIEGIPEHGFPFHVVNPNPS